METGMLPGFHERTQRLCDEIIYYDDGSTDGTYEFLIDQGARVIRSSINNFKNELIHKKRMLEIADDLGADYIFSLDADEYVDINRSHVDELCDFMANQNIDGLKFNFINLWRSTAYKRVDKLFDECKPVKLWRHHRGKDPYPEAKEGLHQALYPSYVINIKDRLDVKIYHLGFSRIDLIVRKFLTYKWNGQSGFNLDRFVDESELSLVEIDHSKLVHFKPDLKNKPTPITKKEYYTSANLMTSGLKRPRFSIVCLIYKDINWLNFVYESILKYTDLSDKEFFFIANDATEEVKEYLYENYIPHYVFNNTEKHKEEHYINNVYRAYNYGVKCARGDYVVLINSDMAFTPNWFENLYKNYDGKTCVASRLVEHGKLLPGKYGIAKNFGDDYSNYKEEEFIKYSEILKEDKNYDGGLYMPLFIRKDFFNKVGGYPEGNVSIGSDIFSPKISKPGEESISGDTVFVQKLKTIGIGHKTCFSSIVYHFQEGEKRSVSSELPKQFDDKLVAVCNDIVTGFMGERVLWDYLLELPKTVGLDYRTVGGKGSVDYKKYVKANLPDLKLVIQNATFMDFVLPDNYTICFLQDDLRKMQAASFDQENNLKLADELATNTEIVAASYPEFDFSCIPVGVDSELFKPQNKSELRKKYNILNTEKVGIFVGALDEVKGWSRVRECIESCPDYKWIIVSKYKESYDHKNVLMFNKVTHGQLVELLNCSDFFILGSLVETQCLAAIEAGMCDLPIIMNKVGIFETFNDDELNSVGVFGKDFKEAVKEVFNKSFEPRKTLLTKNITTDFCKKSWYQLIVWSMQKHLSRVHYLGQKKIIKKAESPRGALYRVEFYLRRKVLRRIIRRDYFYTVPEISVFIKNKSPRFIHVTLRAIWRSIRNAR